MSTSAGKVTVTIVYLVILLGLIYAFHIELLVAGVRLYTLAVKSPRCERLLGDYYQNLAMSSTELASGFYVSGLKSLKDELGATSKPTSQAKIKMNIGRYYECGKGITKDINEATKWYSDALSSLDTAKNQSPSQKEVALRNEINQHLQAIKNPGNAAPALTCALPKPEEFIRSTFWADAAD